MLSVKNLGGGYTDTGSGSSQGEVTIITEGGINTSLMMQKSNPELFVKEQLFNKATDDCITGANKMGMPIDMVFSAQPLIVTQKSFTCVSGFTKK